MWKKLTVCILAALLAAGLAACGGGAAGVRTTQEETLYNGYLGLTVEVPKGIYVMERSDINMTATPEESAELDDLEMELDEYGSYYVPLISMQNKVTSVNNDHAELFLTAELYDDYNSFEEYMEDLVEYVSWDYDDATCELLENRRVNLAGRSFVNLVVEVTVEGPKVYYEEYYVTQVGDLYLTAYIDYWADSEISKEAAYEMLASFSLKGQSL